MRAATTLTLGCCLIVLGLLPGCLDAHTWVEKGKPWNQAAIEDASQVRVERADGTRITLEHPRIEHRGEETILTGRSTEPTGPQVQIDLATVRSLEARETDTGKLVAGIAAGIVVIGGILLYLFHPFSPSA